METRRELAQTAPSTAAIEPTHELKLVGPRHATILLTREDLLARVEKAAHQLEEVDSEGLANRAFDSLRDGMDLDELDKVLVSRAAALIFDEPNYSKLAARLLLGQTHRELAEQNINSFSESIARTHWVGILGDRAAELVTRHSEMLDAAICPERDDLYTFLGMRTVYDRYLLKHPESRKPLESPQYFLMRVAVGLSESPEEAIEFYEVISRLEYMPSSPTLFNSATRRSQMSSCYLLDSPSDDLEAIYSRYMDIAKLSKFAGGIGLSFSRVRSAGSLIRGTNGHSNGIVPFLKTLDSSVSAVNQGGRRKGACCVYLETWHADIKSFLELRDNTGDHAQRTHNLNLSNWIPDLFMKRVEADEMWSLFDPKKVPELVDSYGEEFEKIYLEAEGEEQFEDQIKARDLYARMLRTLAQTGNGWMTFKDSCNNKSNQTARPGNVVHSSNLCTEIVEVTSEGETAVCNLGSINLSKFVRDDSFDFEALAERVSIAVKYLDRVVDINFYPTREAGNSNARWRPVGLGIMGLQDVFFRLRMPFDSPQARTLSARIMEEVYYHALVRSCDLAQELGPHASFPQTRAASGVLQFDLWNVTPSDTTRWDALKDRIQEHGLRNSLLIAIAPTVTISSITGCYECIEPQVSNLFKRETLSGEFLQVNEYLVRDLKSRRLWNDKVRNAIRQAEGSIQEIEGIPEDLKELYRTAWEIPQRALIDMMAERGPYIDQSASCNLFMADPNIGRLSSMYMHAWRSGLKTTYYLRSRPATSIRKTSGVETVANEAVTCSLENPEICESCQ